MAAVSRRSFARRILLAVLSITTAALWASVFCVSAGFVGLCAGLASNRWEASAKVTREVVAETPAAE